MTLFDESTPLFAQEREMRTRVRLLIAYEGSGFKGFAVQAAGVRTVASVLQEAAAKVLGHPIKLTCAGRTDAGVHAWGQVVHFDSPLDADDVDVVSLRRGLNRMLKPSVVVRDAALVDQSFDARRSATARRYRYTIVNTPTPDPFRATTAWHVEQPLDVRALLAGCDPFIGEHDFASFCKKPDDPSRTMTRRVHDATWLDLGDGILRFDIEAQSFCHQMVRSIVGTLVDVGLAKRTAGDIAWTLRARDRSFAGPVAPPHGLCLWEVLYE
jgi:tRNA pseudouridine38-40 synthase